MDRTMPDATPSRRKAGVLINRDFALLWLGQSLSVVGDYVYNTALVLWVAKSLLSGVAWAPLAVSGIYVATIGPQLLIGPAAGVFVDRWDKRRTMLRMDAARAVLIALLVLATGIVPLPFLPGNHLTALQSLIAIYAVVFLAESCGQFFIPARMTLISDIVPSEHQPRAIGMSQVTLSLAVIIGPPIAALLFFTVGIAWTLWINAISFVVSFLCLLAVRAPKIIAPESAEPPNFWRELAGGVRFTLGNRTVMTILIAAAIIMFGAAPMNALGIFFLQQNLHAPAQLYGYLDATMGVGALLGAILFSIFAQRIGLVRLLVLSLLGGGVCFVATSRLTSFTPALVLFGVFGIFQAGINVAIGPLILRVVPRALIGRVSALINPSVSVAILLGTGLSGYLASTVLQGFHTTIVGIAFGPIDTLYMAGGILVLLGATYALVNLGFSDPPSVNPPRSAAPAATPVAEVAATPLSAVAVSDA